MSPDPAQPLRSLTETVLAHGANLRRDYQPLDLHQFRVFIRRIRAIMKYVPCYSDRSLRSGWREMFVVTNPARDWDVFRAAARDLLPAPLWLAFDNALGPHIDLQHQHVSNLLESERWQQHLSLWSEFLAAVDEAAWEPPNALLSRLHTEAERARGLALTEADQVSWHRYRIAIKNLRYVADISAQARGQDAHIDRLVESCKQVQDLLGDWHDSMVQLELIRSPGTARALASSSTKAAEITQALTAALAGRKDRLLIAAAESPPLPPPLQAEGSCRP